MSGNVPDDAGAESVEEWFARVEAALDDERTLAASPPEGTARWGAFPFQVADDARTRRVQPLADTERGRDGEDPATCRCASPQPSGEAASGETDLLWHNENWTLRRFGRTGVPFIGMLQSRAHHDLPDLPDDLAAELGLLVVRLSAAVESLPSVARCHMHRWGDGGAHLHVWFFARPARHPQVVGSVVALWDDVLPALPDAVRDANAAHVARELVARHGGTALSPRP